MHKSLSKKVVRQFFVLIYVFSLEKGFAENRLRDEFVEQLSVKLLGTASPIAAEGGIGYRAIALAAPGTAWLEQNNPLSGYPVGSSSLAVRFNYSVNVNDWTANLLTTFSVDSTWSRLLAWSMPQAGGSPTFNSILYREVDRVDRARGEVAMREPSEAYTRFVEYKRALEILASTSDDNGAWRFHPRFVHHTSLKSARDQLEQDWICYGYRIEIETALTTLEEQSLASGWRNWLRAKALFSENTVAIVSQIPLGKTFFEPDESLWRQTKGWARVAFLPAGSASSVKCELLRVSIRRPWMDSALFSDSQFSLNSNLDVPLVSDGAVPTKGGFGRGIFPNFIEDIVLVRHIEGVDVEGGHPLAGFKYPDEINLLAYVVHTLPAIRK